MGKKGKETPTTSEGVDKVQKDKRRVPQERRELRDLLGAEMESDQEDDLFEE